MVAGMMPSALAFGAGGEFRSPMALAVIGGLIFSTVLSLVFVPAMFMVMDDFGSLMWRLGKRLVVTHHDADHTPDGAHDASSHAPSPGKPAAAAE
jgi:AcrB/AcrD/AcrF family